MSEATYLAKAFWNQRLVISRLRQHLLALSQAVNHANDLSPSQWAQIMAFVLEFKPDLIVELGRGMGNSTCVFAEAAKQLRPHACRVISLCFSNDWNDVTVPRLKPLVSSDWFEPLEILKEDLLSFDYKQVFKGHERVLIFWDAHGYDIAECVLGEILPLIRDKEHFVLMHDISDARYSRASVNSYKGQGLWKGNNWSGPRLRIGIMDTAVEQGVAIYDFASRNQLPLHSADHSMYLEFGEDLERQRELKSILGDELFSMRGHFFWFSLNELSQKPLFPEFKKPDQPSKPSHDLPVHFLKRLRGKLRKCLADVAS